GRKFTELYNGAVGDGATWTLDPQGSRAGERVINVQHLQSAQLDRVSRACISTIQRLYSMLRSLFFWWKMSTARRDQYEETGSALSPWHKVRHPVDQHDRLICLACRPSFACALSTCIFSFS